MAAYNRGPQCAAVIGLFLGLAWLFFSMRMYVKAFLTKSWSVDDFFLIVAMILFTTYSTCAALGVKYGTGKHISEIPFEDIHKALHFWFLCEIFYTLTTVFIRLSIAIFIIRICFKRIYKVIIYTTMVAITAFSTFYFFLVLFQCSPVNYFWNQYKGEKGHCMNPAAVPDASIAHSVVSFTSDWVLGLLPIALIWNLQMNRRTKISLACILAIGLLAGVATMIRIPYIKVLTITDDFLYATTDVAIWSTVEAGLGIVAASAYTLRPLFRSLLSVSSRTGYPSGGKLGRPSSGGAAYNRKNPSGAAPSHISQEQPSQQQQQQRRQDRAIPLSHTANMSTNTGEGGPAPGTRSPFGDSREDVTGARVSAESEGGIQVRRTFEVQRHQEEEEEEGGGEWVMPWRREETGSSVSIV